MSLIEIRAPDDDVEELMHSTARALDAWERQAGGRQMVPAVDRGGEDLRARAATLRHQWRIDSNAIIHSNRPRLGPILIRFQTFVRRATWWFVEPVVQQIRSYQRNSSGVIEDLSRQQTTIIERLAALEEGLARLDEASSADLSQKSDAA